MEDAVILGTVFSAVGGATWIAVEVLKRKAKMPADFAPHAAAVLAGLAGLVAWLCGGNDSIIMAAIGGAGSAALGRSVVRKTGEQLLSKTVEKLPEEPPEQ